MGRKDPPDRVGVNSANVEEGGVTNTTNARRIQLHSEMKERGLVVEQNVDRRRRRRQDRRRRTTEVNARDLKHSSDTIHRNESPSKDARRRKERVDKHKSKSSQSVSFAKEIVATDSPDVRDERVKPLKSSLKNSSALKSLDSERGETSSSGVQSGSNNSDADSINQKAVSQIFSKQPIAFEYF